MTRKSKKEFYKDLRWEWEQARKKAVDDKDAQSLYKQAPNGVSYLSFYFTLIQMRVKNLSGLPYISCKTFKGWKDNGFIVKKGEKSLIHGIVWMHPIEVNEDGEEEEVENRVYPKVYHLFHESQVKPL